MKQVFAYIMAAAFVLSAHPPEALAGEGNQLSIELGMRSWMASKRAFERWSVEGTKQFLPPSTLWFDIPVMYRFSAGGFFSFGIGGMPTIIKTADKTSGGAHLVGTIRGHVVPRWVYIDFDIVLGFPILFGWTPAVGLSFPVSSEINIVVENQFPMAYLGNFMVFWEPSIGIEFSL